MYATTRETYAAQLTNAALDKLDRDLAGARRCWPRDDALLWMLLALSEATDALEKAERFAAAGQAVSS